MNGMLTFLMQVKLLDFNPVLATTSPLLFTWEELGFDHCAEAARLEQDKSQVLSQKCLTATTTQAQEHGGEVDRRCRDYEPGNESDQQAACSIGLSTDSGKDAHEGDDQFVRNERLSNHPEIRVVTEVNGIQPNMPTYGVPYDLIDNSETSAYSDLIEKLRERQIQEVQD